MDWCKLGSGYYRDQAVVAAGEAAEVLFLRGLAYCAEEETAGFIPGPMVAMLAPTRTASRRKALVEHGLWEEAPGGFRVRRWSEWQSELESYARKKVTERDRQRQKRAAALEAAQGVQVSSSVGQQLAGPLPDSWPTSESESESESLETLSVRSPNVSREVIHRPDVDNSAVLAELQRHAPHRRIPPDHVARVVADVLQRGKPTKPTGYVIRAIRNDPARYLPTPMPPRFSVVRGEIA